MYKNKFDSFVLSICIVLDLLVFKIECITYITEEEMDKLEMELLETITSRQVLKHHYEKMLSKKQMHKKSKPLSIILLKY